MSHTHTGRAIDCDICAATHPIMTVAEAIASLAGPKPPKRPRPMPPAPFPALTFPDGNTSGQTITVPDAIHYPGKPFA